MKKHFFLAGLVFLVVSCPACSRKQLPPQEDSTNEQEESYFTGDLSENEMEQTHVSFPLTNNVYVEADVLTPYSKYKNGVNAYYIDHFAEITDTHTEEQVQENLTIFHNNISSIVKTIEEYSSKTFDTSKQTIVYSPYNADYGRLNIQIPLQNNPIGGWELLQCHWNWWPEDGIAKGLEFYYSNFTQDESEDDACYFLGQSTLLNYPDYKQEDLSFASAEELGSTLRVMLENLLNQEIYEYYTYVPLNQENYENLKKIWFEQSVATNTSASFPELTNEFYFYRFWYCLDGLPWKCIDTDLYITDDMILAEGLELQTADDTIRPISEYPQDIIYDASGIRQLVLGRYASVEDIYKEQAPVIDLNEVLLSIKDYFDAQLNLYPITIQSLELCYASAFSSPTDGEIRNVVKPFWSVNYWIEQEQMQHFLFIDAYSGEPQLYSGIVK